MGDHQDLPISCIVSAISSKLVHGGHVVLTGGITDPVVNVCIGGSTFAISSDGLVVDVVEEWTALGGQSSQRNLEVDANHVGGREYG
jgi:hypothetical protein